MNESKKYTSLNGLTLSQQMLSSCVGAFITSIFMTPFDVVKVRLQAQQRALLHQKCFLYCNGIMEHICNCTTAICNNVDHRNWYNRPVPNHLHGTVDAFVKISRSEGYRSLWSGLPPTLVIALPVTVIYLTSYEHFLKYCKSYGSPESPPAWSGGIAGGLARGWAVTVVSPFELLRTKIQAENVTYREVIKSMCKDLRDTGPASLWRGWIPTILRDVPFSVFYWMAYENMKHIYNQQTPSVPFTMAAGSIAGGIAGAVTLPLDVVKTHRQIEIEKSSPNGSSSTARILSHIYKQQGIPGLFTGLTPRLAKVMPACAIMISTYEYAKRYFRKVNYSDSLYAS